MSASQSSVVNIDELDARALRHGRQVRMRSSARVGPLRRRAGRWATRTTSCRPASARSRSTAIAANEEMFFVAAGHRARCATASRQLHGARRRFHLLPARRSGNRAPARQRLGRRARYLVGQHDDAGAEVCEYPDSRQDRRQRRRGCAHMTMLERPRRYVRRRRDVERLPRRASDACSQRESLKKIDREVAKYPPEQKQSAVMAALAIAQDEKG